MSHSSTHRHHAPTPWIARWVNRLLQVELVVLTLIAGGAGIAIAWFALTQDTSPTLAPSHDRLEHPEAQP